MTLTDTVPEGRKEKKTKNEWPNRKPGENVETKQSLSTRLGEVQLLCLLLLSVKLTLHIYTHTIIRSFILCPIRFGIRNELTFIAGVVKK